VSHDCQGWLGETSDIEDADDASVTARGDESRAKPTEGDHRVSGATADRFGQS
jgi:hypothetical protein